MKRVVYVIGSFIEIHRSEWNFDRYWEKRVLPTNPGLPKDFSQFMQFLQWEEEEEGEVGDTGSVHGGVRKEQERASRQQAKRDGIVRALGYLEGNMLENLKRIGLHKRGMKLLKPGEVTRTYEFQDQENEAGSIEFEGGFGEEGGDEFEDGGKGDGSKKKQSSSLSPKPSTSKSTSPAKVLSVYDIKGVKKPAAVIIGTKRSEEEANLHPKYSAPARYANIESRYREPSKPKTASRNKVPVDSQVSGQFADANEATGSLPKNSFDVQVEDSRAGINRQIDKIRQTSTAHGRKYSPVAANSIDVQGEFEAEGELEGQRETYGNAAVKPQNLNLAAKNSAARKLPKTSNKANFVNEFSDADSDISAKKTSRNQSPVKKGSEPVAKDSKGDGRGVGTASFGNLQGSLDMQLPEGDKKLSTQLNRSKASTGLGGSLARKLTPGNQLQVAFESEDNDESAASRSASKSPSVTKTSRGNSAPKGSLQQSKGSAGAKSSSPKREDSKPHEYIEIDETGYLRATGKHSNPEFRPEADSLRNRQSKDQKDILVNREPSESVLDETAKAKIDSYPVFNSFHSPGQLDSKKDSVSSTDKKQPITLGKLSELKNSGSLNIAQLGRKNSAELFDKNSSSEMQSSPTFVPTVKASKTSGALIDKNYDSKRSLKESVAQAVMDSVHGRESMGGHENFRVYEHQSFGNNSGINVSGSVAPIENDLKSFNPNRSLASSTAKQESDKAGSKRSAANSNMQQQPQNIEINKSQTAPLIAIEPDVKSGLGSGRLIKNSNVSALAKESFDKKHSVSKNFNKNSSDGLREAYNQLSHQNTNEVIDEVSKNSVSRSHSRNSASKNEETGINQSQNQNSLRNESVAEHVSNLIENEKRKSKEQSKDMTSKIASENISDIMQESVQARDPISTAKNDSLKTSLVAQVQEQELKTSQSKVQEIAKRLTKEMTKGKVSGALAKDSLLDSKTGSSKIKISGTQSITGSQLKISGQGSEVKPRQSNATANQTDKTTKLSSSKAITDSKRNIKNDSQKDIIQKSKVSDSSQRQSLAKNKGGVPAKQSSTAVLNISQTELKNGADALSQQRPKPILKKKSTKKIRPAELEKMNQFISQSNIEQLLMNLSKDLQQPTIEGHIAAKKTTEGRLTSELANMLTPHANDSQTASYDKISNPKKVKKVRFQNAEEQTIFERIYDEVQDLDKANELQEEIRQKVLKPQASNNLRKMLAKISAAHERQERHEEKQNDHKLEVTQKKVNFSDPKPLTDLNKVDTVLSKIRSDSVENSHQLSAQNDRKSSSDKKRTFLNKNESQFAPNTIEQEQKTKKSNSSQIFDNLNKKASTLIPDKKSTFKSQNSETIDIQEKLDEQVPILQLNNSEEPHRYLNTSVQSKSDAGFNSTAKISTDRVSQLQKQLEVKPSLIRAQDSKTDEIVDQIELNTAENSLKDISSPSASLIAKTSANQRVSEPTPKTSRTDFSDQQSQTLRTPQSTLMPDKKSDLRDSKMNVQTDINGDLDLNTETNSLTDSQLIPGKPSQVQDNNAQNFKKTSTVQTDYINQGAEQTDEPFALPDPDYIPKKTTVVLRKESKRKGPSDVIAIVDLTGNKADGDYADIKFDTDVNSLGTSHQQSKLSTQGQNLSGDSIPLRKSQQQSGESKSAVLTHVTGLQPIVERKEENSTDEKIKTSDVIFAKPTENDSKKTAAEVLPAVPANNRKQSVEDLIAGKTSANEKKPTYGVESLENSFEKLKHDYISKDSGAEERAKLQAGIAQTEAQLYNENQLAKDLDLLSGGQKLSQTNPQKIIEDLAIFKQSLSKNSGFQSDFKQPEYDNYVAKAAALQSKKVSNSVDAQELSAVNSINIRRPSSEVNEKNNSVVKIQDWLAEQQPVKESEKEKQLLNVFNQQTLINSSQRNSKANVSNQGILAAPLEPEAAKTQTTALRNSKMISDSSTFNIQLSTHQNSLGDIEMTKEQLERLKFAAAKLDSQRNAAQQASIQIQTSNRSNYKSNDSKVDSSIQTDPKKKRADFQPSSTDLQSSRYKYDQNATDIELATELNSLRSLDNPNGAFESNLKEAAHQNAFKKIKSGEGEIEFDGNQGTYSLDEKSKSTVTKASFAVGTQQTDAVFNNKRDNNREAERMHLISSQTQLDQNMHEIDLQTHQNSMESIRVIKTDPKRESYVSGGLQGSKWVASQGDSDAKNTIGFTEVSKPNSLVFDQNQSKKNNSNIFENNETLASEANFTVSKSNMINKNSGQKSETPNRPSDENFRFQNQSFSQKQSSHDKFSFGTSTGVDKGIETEGRTSSRNRNELSDVKISIAQKTKEATPENSTLNSGLMSSVFKRPSGTETKRNSSIFRDAAKLSSFRDNKLVKANDFVTPGDWIEDQTGVYRWRNVKTSKTTWQPMLL